MEKLAITTIIETGINIIGDTVKLIHVSAGIESAGSGTRETAEKWGVKSDIKTGGASGRWYGQENEARERFAEITAASTPEPGNNAMMGDIIELLTVDGDFVRVARQQFDNPSMTILATFTRNGDRKGGRGIHRGNLLTDGTELTPGAQLEDALRAHGWSVARYPRSAEQRAKLAGMGFSAIIQTEPGQFEPHPLGLAWAKPGAVVASGEQSERITSDEDEARAALTTSGERAAKIQTVELRDGAGRVRLALAGVPKGCDSLHPLQYGAHGVAQARAAKLRADGIAATVHGRGPYMIEVDPTGEVVAESCATLIPGRWIPNGAENAERIALDAVLGAEVWLIPSGARTGALAVIAYAGKRTKHDAHYTMRDRAQALQWAGEYMGKQQSAAQRRSEQRAEKAAKRAAGHKLKAGDVLRCSWGYDQTNIDYYEVTRLLGARMVEIRAIGAESIESGSMTGECVPRPRHYIGEPMRKAVSDYDGQSVRIASYASAHKIEPCEVAGVKIYPVDHWTSYA